MLSTEAFRLWAVVASYGQGGHLYRELYPVLMRTLQTLPTELSTHPPKPLSVQRMAALLTLLTQLTLAASSTHPEPSSDSAEACVSAIHSSVTWTQVSGLQPLIEPCLKQTLKFLSRPDVWNALGPVPSACLLFLGAYYQAWSQQSDLCPEDWLQDMERLLDELLLPLLSEPSLGRLWDSLRHCSPLCNPLSCTPAPEALPSLVSLGCAGGCPPLSIAGSTSPFPFLTALLSLLNILVRIHKGLCGQLAAVLTAPGLQNYFPHCSLKTVCQRSQLPLDPLTHSPAGTPAGTHSSATAPGRGIHFQAAAGSAGPRPWCGGGQYWWLTVAAVWPLFGLARAPGTAGGTHGAGPRQRRV